MARLKSATDFNAPRAKVWDFESDSNPNKSYQSVLYTNGTTSCNCMGWTRHKQAGGDRTCKHVEWIAMGLADARCAASNDFRQEGVPDAVKQVLNENQKQAETRNISFGKRKLAL